MKNSILAIALAVASTPFMFAAQAPQANPPASGANAPKSTSATTTTKKHKKHVKKVKTAKPTNEAKPAASSSVVKPAGK